MKNNNYMKRAVFSLLFFPLLVICIAFSIHFNKRVSVSDALMYMAWLGENTTRYSSGFSEEKFSQIEPKMRKSDVIDLLGEPIGYDNYEKGKEDQVMMYSKGDADRNYWAKEIYLDDDNFVIKIKSYYFVD